MENKPNMKLQLVSKEQAIRLRDIGFPQDKHDLGYTICNCSDGFNVYKEGTLTENASSMIKKVSAPSLELVAKWLDEYKDIHISIVYRRANKRYITYVAWNKYNRYHNKSLMYAKREEALSIGIDEAIKILKKNESINN